MSDLVGNPEDRFSYNEAHLEMQKMIGNKTTKTVDVLTGSTKIDIGSEIKPQEQLMITQ